ncbi:hypothetical protein B7495_18245 (plasmid) [Cryobacterium sp. LW097]|uniref:hypothetical protein n=1 Tax=unclassified Cryobacterium TaxID=2649013 RepID=UPI000B4C36B8|nr:MULTISPECIES: hypothetical protein [unclassified Cryobacterium]ASD24225.1 hypothetical protein B7495_18245 [Cryobacterium sp. LW097]TFC57881.1 hypothetical protein E3O68_02380 [Cryobacterium sp. TMB3-1-2]TFC63270.1 hypothetical protein E3O60_00265 [Cryobacterium sp. TMB1-7]TFC75377.1 hypothetical protein E3T21_00105 [Cryobacterium sp. TMB3-15]TFC77875.1 hypothetical protein E3T22_04630 [Cryobacterium sp. TMB3-10]
MKATEVERFGSHVVKGPATDDCWIWTGAIADDGYGRFWTKDGDDQKVYRPQRFTYQLDTGKALPSSVLLPHSCDVPICVHTVRDAAESYLSEDTNKTNMLDRAQKNRHANRWPAWQFNGLAREEGAQRSRDLRDVILTHGWDPERMSAALAGVEETHPRLF